MPSPSTESPFNSKRVALALVVLPFIASCTSGDSEIPKSASGTTIIPTSLPISTMITTTSLTPARTISITVENKAVVGGAQIVKLKRSEKVRLIVSSDVADEVHVHGYDLVENVGPGSDAIIDFDADNPGVFEVELEHKGLKLADLQISG